MIDFGIQRYAFFALGAAALFGAGTPLAKLLLQDIDPVMLAGLLYLGSGSGLLATRLAGRLLGSLGHAIQGDAVQPAPALPAPTIAMDRAQLGWLAAAILSGGVAAPLLLMWGLARSSASSASLLLNAESVLTTLLAALLFSEHIGRRIWMASLLMLVAGATLSWSPGSALSSPGLSPGSLAVIAACFFWGLDNNFTRRIAGGNAMTIAMLKGFTAGGVNLTLAWLSGLHWPSPMPLAGALLLGALAYGASLVFYVRALRHLGSARTAAHFATAPFVGAGIALLLGEQPAPAFAMGLVLMIVATWLVLTEQHRHAHTHEALAHTHEALAHTHEHEHDEHHHHSHGSAALEAEARAGKPHTHPHVHAPLTHRHPHLPDLHHRHTH